jgi:phosphate transport system permease protein
MALATDLTTSRVEETLQGDHRDIGGSIFAGILLFALIASLAVLLLLFWSVAQRGVPLLAERGLNFLTDGPSAAPSRAGIGPALFGSVVMMGIVAIVAFPLGVAAAVYLEEYARDTKMTRLLTANIRNLAGVPSIVYGILGLVVFVVALQKAIAINQFGSLISGGLTLAVLILPIVIITTSEALRAVPSSVREAAYGVGATRWEVIRSHVLPYALPGILTGVIVSLARAFGETAPLLLVGAVRGFFTTTGSLFDQIFQDRYTALPVQIFAWAGAPQPEFKDLAAAAILVMMVVLILMNGIAIWLRNRYERRW